jgi:hypothetical protein
VKSPDINTPAPLPENVAEFVVATKVPEVANCVKLSVPKLGNRGTAHKLLRLAVKQIRSKLMTLYFILIVYLKGVGRVLV